MRFTFHGDDGEASTAAFTEGLAGLLQEKGHRRVPDADGAQVVFHVFPYDRPRGFRRRSRSVFVVGVTRTPEGLEAPLEEGYRRLVRSISNLLIILEGEGPSPSVHFVTPERGHYVVPGVDGRPASGGAPDARRNGAAGGGQAFEVAYREALYHRIEPLASSTLVLRNVFETDLPEELREGDEITASIERAGRRLAELELLPAPFPLEEVLPPADRRHLERLFGIGGLSYGNVSARKDEGTFWMSASGVDKSRLREVGREVLLVKDYDARRNAMVLSVPPDVEPARVSVDAIEHWAIYREHPDVGAILHVHAWMEGVPSTEINYPCGTLELARAVASKVNEAEDPSRAVVGLKNHGLTLTGRSLEDIFQRIEGRIERHVPMS